MERELSIEFTRNPFIIRVRYDGKLIWEHYYEHPVDFITRLESLMTLNDKEIYDTLIVDTKNNDLVKKEIE